MYLAAILCDVTVYGHQKRVWQILAIWFLVNDISIFANTNISSFGMNMVLKNEIGYGLSSQ